MSGLAGFSAPTSTMSFTESCLRSLQLQIQLHIDNLSQEEFFHSMITAYIYQHPDFVEYIKGVKAQKDEHPKEYKKKVAKTYASYEAVI